MAVLGGCLDIGDEWGVSLGFANVGVLGGGFGEVVGS